MHKLPKKNIYNVILTSNGKRIKTLCTVSSEKTAYKKFKELIEENKKVSFPVRYINIGKLVNAHYELFIIKKNEDDNKTTKLKDENGRITEYQTDNDNWIIIDREDYDKEETFWVYGYHPVFQRKTFKWIYNEMCKNRNNKNDIIQIYAFRNKLLISTTYNMDMVMCKNISDCIRLYNELERKCKENKLKYIFFMGDAYNSALKKDWFKKIKELTGWSDTKIQRKNLRP